ncbi:MULTISPECIES: serine hydrolase [Bacillaceae]|uniref:serine hydrolase n=1 Tax=Bacillaceae TaxID=186817 RepID=UPI00069FE2D9|nr:serine hydrolase [Bacillus sp. FJAT-27916]
MRQAKQLTSLLAVLTLLLTCVFSFPANNAYAAEDDELGLSAEAAILIDAETGQILYEKNADKLLGVASMSKMMTEYLVLEAIDKGKISWDQKVTIDEYVHKLSAAPGLSNIGLTQGETYTVKELYEAMAIFSGNAATVALAQLVGGTEKNFVKLMNEKANELGLKDYNFVNSSGLNNSSLLGEYPAGNEDDENLMSARATAKLSYQLLKDYPEVLDYAKVPRLKFRDGRTYDNFNWMLPGLIYEYEGVDGLKTGSTEFAGACFTATAEKNGQRYISVVMKTDSKNSRFTETKKVLDYAFNNFTTEEILAKGYQDKSQKTVGVSKGKEDSVAIKTNKAVELVVKNGEEENVKTKLVINKDKLDEDGNLVAPVKKGDKIGYLTVETDNNYGTITGDSKGVRVDVVAAETVEKANWFVLSMRAVGGFFGDMWGSITGAVKGLF